MIHIYTKVKIFSLCTSRSNILRNPALMSWPITYLYSNTDHFNSYEHAILSFSQYTLAPGKEMMISERSIKKASTKQYIFTTDEIVLCLLDLQLYTTPLQMTRPPSISKSYDGQCCTCTLNENVIGSQQYSICTYKIYHNQYLYLTCTNVHTAQHIIVYICNLHITLQGLSQIITVVLLKFIWSGFVFQP